MTARVRVAVVLLATLLGMALTGSLGRWQLARAAQKEALQTQLTRQRELSPLDASQLENSVSLDGRRVRLQGKWLPAHTVYLDNRPMHQRQGFYVLTPFQLAHSPLVVLVQRGWVGRDFQDRTRVAAPAPPVGPVQVVGRIAPGPSQLFALGNSVEAQASIRQNLSLASFRVETRLPLWDHLVLQTDAGTADGLSREWPEPSLGIEKHYGYAFQWFGLCGLIAALYVWFQLIPRKRARHAST